MRRTTIAPAPDWDCVSTGAALAMIRMLDVDLPGEALRAKIEANLARQSAPELSAIHLVRKRSDLTERNAAFCHGLAGSAVVRLTAFSQSVIAIC